MRARGGAKALIVHRGAITTPAASNARWQEVARRSTKMLIVSASGTKGSVGRVERSGSRARAGCSTHGGSLAHAKLRRVVHGRRISRVGNNCSSSSASTAAKTAYVLGEVVIATDLIAALPITCTERNNTTAAHTAAATTTVAHVAAAMVAAVVRRRHHRRWPIAIAKVAFAARTARASSRERASEASSSALEVGESARGACPIARTGSVLAGREGCEDVLGAVENAARRGRHLDGLFIQRSTVHAQTLGSLANVRNIQYSSVYR